MKYTIYIYTYVNILIYTYLYTLFSNIIVRLQFCEFALVAPVTGVNIQRNGKLGTDGSSIIN